MRLITWLVKAVIVTLVACASLTLLNFVLDFELRGTIDGRLPRDFSEYCHAAKAAAAKEAGDTKSAAAVSALCDNDSVLAANSAEWIATLTYPLTTGSSPRGWFNFRRPEAFALFPLPIFLWDPAPPLKEASVKPEAANFLIDEYISVRRNGWFVARRWFNGPIQALAVWVFYFTLFWLQGDQFVSSADIEGLTLPRFLTGSRNKETHAAAPPPIRTEIDNWKERLRQMELDPNVKSAGTAVRMQAIDEMLAVVDRKRAAKIQTYRRQMAESEANDFNRAFAEGLTKREKSVSLLDAEDAVHKATQNAEENLAATWDTYERWTWLLPQIGFFGTLYGMGFTFEKGSDITRAELPAKKTEAYQDMLGGLATAFDCTLVALVLMVVLRFIKGHVQDASTAALRSTRDLVIRKNRFGSYS